MVAVYHGVGNYWPLHYYPLDIDNLPEEYVEHIQQQVLAQYGRHFASFSLFLMSNSHFQVFNVFAIGHSTIVEVLTQFDLV